MRVTVGLSQKVTKNYCSRGYSLQIEAEVAAEINDSQPLIQRV